MCGRMTIATEQEVLEARFHAKATEKIEKHFNAFPNHDKYPLPVITVEDPDHITMRYWGMVPVWWKRDTRGLINVTYETLRDKKTFHKDLAERRLLVLADGFLNLYRHILGCLRLEGQLDAHHSDSDRSR